MRLEQILTSIGKNAQASCRLPSMDPQSLGYLRRLWLEQVDESKLQWLTEGRPLGIAAVSKRLKVPNTPEAILGCCNEIEISRGEFIASTPTWAIPCSYWTSPYRCWGVCKWSEENHYGCCVDNAAPKATQKCSKKLIA